MAALPVIPTFSQNDSSLAKLQQLSQAASFLASCDTRPAWHFYKIGIQSFTANTWSTVNMGTVAFDSDSTFTTGGYATIVTQGYYAVEACMGILSPGTSAQMYRTAFQLTAGSANPHYATGATVRFGYRGASTVPETGVDTTYCIADIAPVCLYPGDIVAAQLWANTGVTLNNNVNGSYASGRMVANFTGYYWSEGT